LYPSITKKPIIVRLYLVALPFVNPGLHSIISACEANDWWYGPKDQKLLKDSFSCGISLGLHFKSLFDV
jgi:hypothetical protein